MAFNRMLRARGFEDDERVAPLVELGQDLARVLDAKGLTARPLASYMAVLRAFDRVPAAEDEPVRGGVVETAVSEPEDPSLNALERFKRARGIGDTSRAAS